MTATTIDHTVVATGSSPVDRIVYGVLGLFFAAITARVLLNDVHAFSDLTVDHYLTIGALVGAVASGVAFWVQARKFKLVSALGFGTAFVLATFYCLIGSAGRGDDLAYKANAEARQINQNRLRYERDRTEAKGRWETAQTAEATECASGLGTRCQGRRATTEKARSAYEVADLLVRQAQPEARENGKFKRVTELWVAASGHDEAKTEKVLAAIWPFIPPGICELLTINFFHLAFIPVRRRRQFSLLHFLNSLRVPTPLALPPPSSFPVAATVATVAVARKPKRQRPTDVKLVHDAITALGGEAESQDQLADVMGVHKSEVSKRIEACGDFVVVERVGRCNVIRINPKFDYV